MPRYGANPQVGLEPRTCIACGKQFQPYRAVQVTCPGSRKCYRARPDRREAERKANAEPARRDRKNEMRRTNPRQVETIRNYNRKKSLERAGWTVEEYEAALTAQAAACQICGRKPKPDGKRAASKLHADHDHVTGRKRDLLCGSCNTALGLMNDDPELLSAAAAYIRRHRAL